MTAPLFRRALGAAWTALPPEVRALHTIDGFAVWTGEAEVTRGRGLFARFAARCAGFPPAGQGVPVRLTLTTVGDGELWERDFGGARFESRCLPAPIPGHSREKIGPVLLELALPVRQGVLSLDVRRGWIWGVPIPRRLLPVSDSREFATDGRFHFDVSARAPLGGGLIVRYRGWLVPASDPEA